MTRLTILLLLACAGPALAAPPYPHQLPDWLTGQRAALEKKLDLDFSDTPLQKALDHIGTATGLAIRIDAAPADRKVQLRVGQLKAKSCLMLIVSLEQLKLCHEPKGLVVTDDASKYPGPAALKTILRIERAGAWAYSKYRPERRITALETKLGATRAGVSFAGVSLTDAVQMLQRSTRVNIVITNEGKTASAGAKVAMEDTQLTLNKALPRMLTPLGLGYWIREGVVFIDTAKNAKKFNDEAAALRRALAALRARPIGGELKGTPLHALAAPLSKAAGVPCYIDRQAWDRAAALAASTDGKRVGDLEKAVEAEELVLVIQTDAIFLVTRKARK